MTVAIVLLSIAVVVLAGLLSKNSRLLVKNSQALKTFPSQEVFRDAPARMEFVVSRIRELFEEGLVKTVIVRSSHITAQGREPGIWLSVCVIDNYPMSELLGRKPLGNGHYLKYPEELVLIFAGFTHKEIAQAVYILAKKKENGFSSSDQGEGVLRNVSLSYEAAGVPKVA